MSMTIKDLSVVLLSDGREGTVVHTYADGNYEVELSDPHELRTVTRGDIQKVTWIPPQ